MVNILLLNTIINQKKVKIKIISTIIQILERLKFKTENTINLFIYFLTQ